MSLDSKLKKRLQYTLLLIFSPLIFQACQSTVQVTNSLPTTDKSLSSPSIYDMPSSTPTTIESLFPTPLPMCSPAPPVYENYFVSIDNKSFKRILNEDKYINDLNFIDTKNIIYNKYSQNSLMKFNTETQDNKEILKGSISFAISPDKKQIAYITYDGTSKYNLFISDIEGLNSKKMSITPLDFPSSYIHWSPDNKKIAVNQNLYTDKEETLIFDISGKTYKISQVSISMKNLWSPDSKKIAFITGDQLRQLAYYDIETNQQKNIGNDSIPKSYPLWAADSNRLFYHPLINGKSSIFITNLDGSNQKMVADGITSGYYISDDNKFLAYSSIENSKASLYMLDTNTLSTKPLTDLDNKLLSDVKWFSNNENIVYSVSDQYNSDIYKSRNNIDLYTIKSDGTTNQRLTNSPTSERTFVLSPDNKTILFTSDISLYAPDGCNAQQVENWDYTIK